MNKVIKEEQIKKFIDRFIPVVLAKNPEANLRFYLERKLFYFYDDAFIEGQENVLKQKNPISPPK